MEGRQTDSIDHAIGATLRELREKRGLSARQLARSSDVSAAMISRIENGQVSPSIATLGALAKALDVPVVSLFRSTASGHADFTHIRKGEGLVSTRLSDGHEHEYVTLANRPRRDVRFQAHLVTLRRQDDSPPIYVGHGVILIHALRGEAIYTYGHRQIHLREGDSLSLDAELRHGFSKVLSEEFVFVNVQAEAG